MPLYPQTLRASFWDIAFYSLMVGLSETYIAAFALALGFSAQTSGMIATIPLLVASILQVFAGIGVRILQSHRRWVLVCASTQALTLLGLSVIGFTYEGYDQNLQRSVFCLVTLYWAAAVSSSPSWNAWVAGSVPDGLRTSFFALRARIGQLCTVVGLAVTGLALQSIHDGGQKLRAFGVIFAVAGLCRLVSTFFLSRHPESRTASRSAGLRMLLHPHGRAWLRERRTSVIILFMLTTHFAINVSGPYFNAYMLKHLGLSYQDYMILIGTSFITRVLAGGYFQKFAQKYGATSLTHLGSLLVIPSAILWNFSDSFAYLFVLHIFTGVAWGCHELGVTLLLLDKQGPEERARFLTLTNLSNAIAMFLGSTSGYLLLAHDQLRTEHYHTIFALSTLLRIVPFAILPLLGDSQLKMRGWARQLAYGGRRLFKI